MECWYKQNEYYQNPKKQRKYMIKWMEEIKKMIKSSNKSHAIRCLKNRGININKNRLRICNKETYIFYKFMKSLMRWCKI